MRFPLLIILTFFANIVPCLGQTDWAESNIPDSLRSNSDAVIRCYETEYILNNESRYTKKVHLVITVLNEDGRRTAQLMIPYDKHSSVSSFKGVCYTGMGFQADKIKMKDLSDRAYNQSFTLYSDNRVKYYLPRSNHYPYTIEYTYSLDYNGVVAFSPWFPQEDYNTATQKADLYFTFPRDYILKYKALNYPFQADSGLTNGQKYIHWTAKNIPAVKGEPLSPGYFELFPAILVSPGVISYEGTRGNTSNWNSYGKWVYTLVQERDEISDQTAREIQELTHGLRSRRDKIEAVYKYMQKKTRYVNISLGIGGFQPLMAMEVDEKGFGDCKALSNYTKALLKCIGIESCYTEIGNGKNQQIMFPNFPSAYQTNHVILCVPNREDTVWLECTNQNFPFGYLGAGNSDRYALLVSGSGGALARTPKYHANQNLRSTTLKVDLKDNGSAEINLSSHYSFYMYEKIFGLLNSSPKEQKESLLESLDSEGIQFKDFAFEKSLEGGPVASLTLNLFDNNYAQKSGKRLFLKPAFIHPLNLLNQIPLTRQQPIKQPIGYLIKDSLSLKYPENYQLESLPENVHFSSVFGDYQMEYQNSGDGKITITRSVKTKDGVFDKSLFDAINDYLSSISDSEKKQILFIEK